MNILIVDDTPINLKLLRAQLESEGRAVFEAHDGVDALALLNRQRVDAVISDILMPRMDGYRLCHEIRKHARLRDLPIIIYSSTYTAPADEKLALDMGADKYLKKPASVATIVAALHEVIAMPHAARQPEALPEVEVLKEYSERLVSKLEEKNTELQAQTEALRLPSAAMTAAANAIVITDRDGSIVWANPAFSTLTYYSLAEAVGKNPRDLVKSGQQERAVYEEMWATILAGRVWLGQIVNRRKDGSLYPEEQTITPVRDANGEITHFIAIKQDLSERKRAEEAAQRSKKRLRDLIDGIGPSMFVGLMTPQGILIEANRPALAAAGLKPEDVLGKPFEETYWWAYSQEVQQQLREAIARAVHGESSRYDVQLRAAENLLIDVDFSLQPLRDETGEVVFLVPSANVITERKQAEALLNGQKRVLEMIAAGAPLGESLTALVRLIEAHAPGMLGSILLLDADGVHLRDGASPSLPPEYVAAIDGISIGPSAGSCGTAAYSKEAVVVEDIATDPRWADYKAVALPHELRACWSTPIFDAQRRVVGTFAMYYRQPKLAQPDHQRLIDIAVHAAAIAIGRYRTETALRESEERLRLAVQASNVGLWDWDLRTNQVIYSREWKSQLGYEETEIRNEFSEWERLVHPDDLAAAQQRIQRYLARPEGAYEADFRMCHKDGTWRWICARGEFFRDASGKAVRLLGCHIDLTEHKQDQEEILRLNAELEARVQQRTAQLQAANQELEAFSYSVSHDLRSPLNTIDGFSKLLGKEIGASAATERGKHYLARIRAGVVQMGELIDALLSLAQVSRTSLGWESVDLSAMAETVLTGYREREPGRVAQLAIQAGMVVQGDPRLLRQVLDNLLGNAWKFSGQQPQTRIAFGRESGPNGEARYVVRDKGAGFDMAYSEKLFGAFQRLHTESEFAGTGIGLATVHRIVTRHGGRIWAESTPGQGATFYFTLGGPPA